MIEHVIRGLQIFLAQGTDNRVRNNMFMSLVFRRKMCPEVRESRAPIVTQVASKSNFWFWVVLAATATAAIIITFLVIIFFFREINIFKILCLF